MTLLFLARHANYFRSFESVIRLWAERGHQVHLAVERGESVGGSALLDQLTGAYPGVTAGEAPHREAGEWTSLAGRLRRAIDLLRYLEPAYDTTPRLRARAAERAPAFAVAFAGSAWSRSRVARAALGWMLRRAEAAIPPSRDVAGYLRERQADALVMTPLIGVVGSSQPDYLRAARTAHLPAAVAVWSWDHLTSKALIREAPDRVLVWNEVQRDEARRLHGIAPERVVVTGAQCFDQWFGRTPSRTRAEFCAAVGLPDEKPFLLYVGSALFAGSPPEAGFVQQWIAAIRASADPVLRSCGILVRPHPQRMREWEGVDLSGFGDVSVWGGNPVTEPARADYFDSLAYSRAVVGLNTSAFLEAAIAGRPVLAILPDEFRDNQEGTLHFGYLSSVGGGLLRTSRTLAEHCAQLSEELAASRDRRRPRRVPPRVPPPARSRRAGDAGLCRRCRGHGCRGAVAGGTPERCGGHGDRTLDAPPAGSPEPIAPVRALVLRRRGAPRAGVARSESGGAGGVPPRQSRPGRAGRGRKDHASQTDGAVKILFIARHYSYLRLFESAIDGAGRSRPRSCILAADREESMGGRQMVERLAERYPERHDGDAPGRGIGAWAELARQIRLGLDYLRFLEPGYAETPHLRRSARRSGRRACVVRLANSPLGALVGGRRWLAACSAALERGLPIRRRR